MSIFEQNRRWTERLDSLNIDSRFIADGIKIYFTCGISNPSEFSMGWILFYLVGPGCVCVFWILLERMFPGYWRYNLHRAIKTECVGWTRQVLKRPGSCDLIAAPLGTISKRLSQLLSQIEENSGPIRLPRFPTSPIWVLVKNSFDFSECSPVRHYIHVSNRCRDRSCLQAYFRALLRCQPLGRCSLFDSPI